MESIIQGHRRSAAFGAGGYTDHGLFIDSFLTGITRFVVELVFPYTTVMGEPDISPSDRFGVFDAPPKLMLCC